MQKFNVFDPVLTRITENDRWTADFYDYPTTLKGIGVVHYTTSGACHEPNNILPYNNETKHLHNTVGEFVKWVPKKGEPILAKDSESESWAVRIFLGMRDGYYACTSFPENNDGTTIVTWDCVKPYVNPYKE